MPSASGDVLVIENYRYMQMGQGGQPGARYGGGGLWLCRCGPFARGTAGPMRASASSQPFTACPGPLKTTELYEYT